MQKHLPAWSDRVRLGCRRGFMGSGAASAVLRQTPGRANPRRRRRIFDCGGTVEKHIGDAIFAVWGLLTGSADDAAYALRCADGMITALDAWIGERAGAGEMPLAIGIGLHYGPAVIGDVGSGGIIAPARRAPGSGRAISLRQQRAGTHLGPAPAGSSDVIALGGVAAGQGAAVSRVFRRALPNVAPRLHRLSVGSATPAAAATTAPELMRASALAMSPLRMRSWATGGTSRRSSASAPCSGGAVRRG